MLKNAIVVMFDSLQFNYLGCYGNEWIKTPNMDRLSREGVLFENCYTEGLPTVPCRRAMHTGRYTLQKAGWVALTMEDTTIADLCWGRPIDTAIVFDCPMYRLPKFGYTRGFDKVWFTHGHEADDYYYENDPLYHGRVDDYIDAKSRTAYARLMGEASAEALEKELGSYLRQRQYWKGEDDRYVARTMKKAIEYLEQADRNKQFFLWVDSFDPHEPWDPPSVYMKFPCPYDPDYQGKDEFLPYAENVADIYTDAQLRHIRMLYAELVTLCDRCFGTLLDAVRRLGLEENTLIMMVSDHGEPLGKGADGHGLMRKVRPWPYEELVHTPMLLRAPGIKAGQRLKAFVQSCDVAPTVCDWLGIGVHPDMQGKSLLPLVRGETEKVRDFAIAGYNKYSWAMYTDDWSYIHWLSDADDKTMAINFYSSDIDMSHLEAVGGKSAMSELVVGMKEDMGSEVEARHKALFSADGEAQWTCTPGSVVALPEKDELYDRKTDPFQLHNVIDRHKDVAERLFTQLRDYMSELRAS